MSGAQPPGLLGSDTPAASAAVSPKGAPVWRQALARVVRPSSVALALVAVLMLALGLRVAFSFRAPPFVTNDSLSYLLPAFDLIHSGTFAPILKRPPFYSLFIAGVFSLFGEDLRLLMLVQHLLGVGTVALAFGIGRLLFGAVPGLLAALLTALSGPIIVTEHYLMSEALFTFLLASGAVRLSRRCAVAAGVAVRAGWRPARASRPDATHRPVSRVAVACGHAVAAPALAAGARQHGGARGAVRYRRRAVDGAESGCAGHIRHRRGHRRGTGGAHDPIRAAI